MKLGRVVDQQDQPVGWRHFCPGCNGDHMVWVEQPNPESEARWTFDGNEAAPTFAPSVLVYHWSKYGPDGHKAEGAEKITDCHYFLRAGRIEFCSDSRHALAGKTVDLPELEP